MVKLWRSLQAMRTPSRNQAGLELLMEYYNQLYYLDQRFFAPHRPLGVLFHWYLLHEPPSVVLVEALRRGVSLRYDSLTGVPSSQRTLAFEKGSVLFNVGALYTQMGARQDRSAVAGIDTAVDAFQRAAGTPTFAINATIGGSSQSYNASTPPGFMLLSQRCL